MRARLGPVADLKREAALQLRAERNGKKLADGQLPLERRRDFVEEEPVERKVDGDLDENRQAPYFVLEGSM